MKTRIVIGKLSDSEEFKSFEYRDSNALTKALRGNSFSKVYLFGQFAYDEIEIIISCAGGDRKAIKYWRMK